FAGGGFFTPDRRARFVAPQAPALRAPLSAAYPFRLNTGRVRDQWHSMTRSGASPRLGAHCPEPFVAVHPADAAARRLTAGGFATVTTPHGSCALKVVVDAGQREGSLFAPIHWSRATASDGSIGELVMAETDPLSGQPEAKATPATIEPCRLDWRGFLVMREVAELPVGTWWARVALAGGTGWLFASNEPPDTWRTRASHLF